MTTSGDLSSLRGVRLGQRERALLLAAPTPEARREAFEAHRAKAMKGSTVVQAVVASQSMEGVVTGMLPIIEPTRAAKVAAHRAARCLNDLGLVDYANQRYGDRRVCIALTPLGAEVVRRYRKELEEGRRIRWPGEE